MNNWLKMTRHTCLIYLFLTLFFEEIIRTQMSLHDNGFIQSANEVRYFVDDISTMHKEFTSSGVNIPDFDDKISNSKLLLKFDPDILDFKQRDLGVPHHEKVVVTNLNSNKTIVMTSISGNTVHFHCSFFEDKVIPPLGNTTFNVVFLGRQEGPIESVLLIHTSEGSINYKVKGVSSSSPYRLRPLVGIRLPLNASFSPLIYMHNPHPTAIQIVEVYSSGGEFHLELPTGELEGPKQMWEIPPHQTRPVIRIRFNARTEANHTAYVRIKLNNSLEVLVVALEVEVGSFPGLHAPQGGVDFGVGGSLDQAKKVKLLLHNTWKKPIRIQSIVTDTDTKAINIDFQPVKVPPGAKAPTQVAILTFNWNIAYEEKHVSGKLLIRSKQVPHDMIIPYWVTVIEGGLIFNASVTQYLSDKGPPDTELRKFTVTNAFGIPLAVTNISLPEEAQSYFTVQNFNKIAIKPKQTVTLFSLKLRSNNALSDLKFESCIFIHTNVSTVKVPVLSYNGKLKKIIPFAEASEAVLDLGLVGSDSRKEVHFILYNCNPASVALTQWNTDLKGAAVKLMGCGSGNVMTAALNNDFKNLSECSTLQPEQFAVFKVSVVTSRTEGQLWGEVIVETEFEYIATPITLRIAHGKLETVSDKLVFDDCFPGKVCTHPLKMHSTFSRTMDVVSITSVPPDPRLSHNPGGQIPSRVPRIVTQLHFDLVKTCAHQCYTGFTVNSTFGSQWLNSFSLPHTTKELDINLVNTYYGRYLNLTANGLARWQNLSLRLDTTEVKNHMINARVKMAWPKLLTTAALNNKSVVAFPLTQIGNVSYQTVSFHNPSMHVLLMHLVLDWAYPQSSTLMGHIPNAFVPTCSDCGESAPSSMFFFDERHKLANKDFEKQFNIFTHPESLPVTVLPGETVDISVGFLAATTSINSAFLFLRNNLTVLEVIRITGQGAHPMLKFGNRKPGSATPLLFELTEKHLKDCEKEKNRKNPSPNLTVKRSFTARNTGDVGISINNFFINDYPCEGYGFKILNCEPFYLPPNGTRKIDIAFTPDFTLAKVQRMLIIDTSLKVPVNYTLVTTLPPYFLGPCAGVLARPVWEMLLYYSVVSLMALLFFLVCLAAYFDSVRILRTALLALARDTFTLQPPLDLRLVGARTRNEIKSHKIDNESEYVQTSVHNQDNNNKTSELPEKRTKETNNLVTFSTKSTNNWITETENNNSLKNIKSQITNQTFENKTSFTNSVIAPSVKNKKRVAKKNSIENDTPSEVIHEVVPKKNNALPSKALINKNKITVSPTIVDARKSKQDVESNPKKVVEKDPNKKHFIHKKNKHVVENICSEEETSSTTTESSNNEEIDKENVSNASVNKHDKNRKVNQKKNKLTAVPACDFRDNYEGDGEDEEYERIGKQTINVSHVRPYHENKLNAAKTNESSKNTDVQKPEKDIGKIKLNRNSNRERKEKSVQKKRINDKNVNNNKFNNHETAKHTVVAATNVSPTFLPPSNCWGENRASFSDVVARSDSALYSNILASKEPNKQDNTSKQQMQSVFGSDYRGSKQSDSETNNSDLGPIGSKKSPVNAWNNVADKQPVKPQFTSCVNSSMAQQQQQQQQQQHHQQQQQQQQQPPVVADSFFVNSYVDQALSVDAYLAARVDALATATDIWEAHPSATSVSMMNHILQNSGRSHLLGNQSNFQNGWPTNGNSVWGNSLYLPPAVGEERQQVQQQQQQMQHVVGLGLGGTSNTVWDASPWTVPTPLVPGTPTRTPPGFRTRTAMQDDDVDHGLGFDPFRSLSDIWTPPRAPPHQ